MSRQWNPTVNRTAVALCAFALLSLSATNVFGQGIVVRSKPGSGCWTVWYTRVMNPSENGGELSGMFATLAQAKNDAARLQRWNAQIEGRDWKLHTIYIEGEDNVSAVPPPQAAPKTPDYFTAVYEKMQRDRDVQNSLRELNLGRTDTGQFAADLLKDPDKALNKELAKIAADKAWGAVEQAVKQKLIDKTADALGEPRVDLSKIKDYFADYKKEVANAYKRAKDAKDEMLGINSSLAEKRFGEVNKLVDQYNKSAENVPPGLALLNKAMPRMPKVDADSLRKADDWRDAVGKQFGLEKRKEQLDGQRESIERRRQDLLAEWKELSRDGKPSPYDPKVISLRERIKEHKSSHASYQTSLDEYRGEVGSLAQRSENMRSGQRGRSGGQAGGGSLAGDWTYRGGDRTVFTIYTDGTARATAYYANGGTNRIRQSGDNIEIVVPATWGPFSRQPYLHWSLRREGDELVGTHRYYQNETQGWSESSSTRLVRKAGPPPQAPRPEAPQEKICYVNWIDEHGGYGGMTSEEAIASARRLKELNPNSSIRVTVHRYVGNKSMVEVTQTPGTTVFELP